MTDGNSFAILGGYGQLGLAVAALLLDRGPGRVTISGRSREKAEDAAIRLALDHDAGRVVPDHVDANDEDGLAALLTDHDVLIHAAPLESAASKVLCGALRRTAGRVVLVSHNGNAIADLRSERSTLEQAGARLIVDAGADPGLPGMAAHLAVEAHGAADGVEIGARYRAPRIGRAGLADILDGASDAAWIYEKGWRRAGLLEVRRQVWPRGLGTSLAMPVYLPELDAVRDCHGLTRIALWHGGLNALADMIVFLQRVLGRSMPQRIGLAAMQAAMRFTNPPPYGLGVSAVATGRGRRREIRLSHPDVYQATAQIVAWSAWSLARENIEAPALRVAFEQLCASDSRSGLEEAGFDVTFRR